MDGRLMAERKTMATAISTAWHTAAFMRTNPKHQLPALDRIIRKIVKAVVREQTPEEGLRIAEQMNAILGGRDLRPKMTESA